MSLAVAIAALLVSIVGCWFARQSALAARRSAAAAERSAAAASRADERDELRYAAESRPVFSEFKLDRRRGNEDLVFRLVSNGPVDKVRLELDREAPQTHRALALLRQVPGGEPKDVVEIGPLRTGQEVQVQVGLLTLPERQARGAVAARLIVTSTRGDLTWPGETVDIKVPMPPRSTPSTISR